MRVAQASVNFTGSTRLPMVAGWDDLLPQWFVRLHPRYRTPVNSILFVGAVTLAVAMAVVIGVGEQEAFQLLNNASGDFLRAHLPGDVRAADRGVPRQAPGAARCG